MKVSWIYSQFASIGATLGIMMSVSNGHAALTFSGLSVSPHEFSVHISGTLPDIGGYESTINNFFFTNWDGLRSPGFVADVEWLRSSAATFSGAQVAEAGRLGSPAFGDYFIIDWESDLICGEVLNGALVVTWDQPVFDPTQTQGLDIEWVADFTRFPLGSIARTSLHDPSGPGHLAAEVQERASGTVVLHQSRTLARPPSGPRLKWNLFDARPLFHLTRVPGGGSEALSFRLSPKQCRALLRDPSPFFGIRPWPSGP